MVDSRHDINIRQYGDNSGRNFLIGLVVTVGLFYLWRDGTFQDWSAYFSKTDLAGGSNGYAAYKSGSVTAIVLPLLFKVLAAVGWVAIMLVTGLWYVLWDVGSGIFQAIRSWQAKNAAITEATEIAKSQAVNAAVVSAMAPVASPLSVYSVDELVAAVSAVNDDLEYFKKEVEARFAVRAELDKAKPKTAKRPASASKHLEKTGEAE